jgi:hypothetical protein
MRLRLAIGILGVCAGFLANTAPTNAALEPEYTQESVQLVGTCGNVWAKADVVRQYVFNTHRSHVDVWRLRTREGQRFTTFAGASPNACSTDIERGVSIIGGIHSIEIIGGMYIYVDAPAGSFDGDAVCQAPCTAGQFVAAFYGTDTTWTAPQGPRIVTCLTRQRSVRRSDRTYAAARRRSFIHGMQETNTRMIATAANLRHSGSRCRVT